MLKNGQKLETIENIVTDSSFFLFQGCRPKVYISTLHYHQKI